MTKQVFQTTFAGRELIVETGQVAKQANGSVVVRYGESTVLTAAVMSKKMATGDFFPLQVNYEEKNVCGWEISWWLYETGRSSFY